MNAFVFHVSFFFFFYIFQIFILFILVFADGLAVRRNYDIRGMSIYTRKYTNRSVAICSHSATVFLGYGASNLKSTICDTSIWARLSEALSIIGSRSSKRSNPEKLV